MEKPSFTKKTRHALSTARTMQVWRDAGGGTLARCCMRSRSAGGCRCFSCVLLVARFCARGGPRAALLRGDTGGGGGGGAVHTVASAGGSSCAGQRCGGLVVDLLLLLRDGQDCSRRCSGQRPSAQPAAVGAVHGGCREILGSQTYGRSVAKDDVAAGRAQSLKEVDSLLRTRRLHYRARLSAAPARRRLGQPHGCSGQRASRR